MAATKPADILETYQRLVKQGKTGKASTWSNRTLERALGWAALADKALASDQSSPNSLLRALVLSPLASPEVVSTCENHLSRTELEQIQIEKAESQRVCVEELPKRLKYAKLDEDELMLRVAAKKINQDCCKNHLLRQKLERQARLGHQPSLKILLKLASCNKIDHWSISTALAVWPVIRRLLPEDSIALARQQNREFALMLDSS